MAGVLAGVAASVLAPAAGAQARPGQQPSADTPRMLVLVFRGNEPKSGVEAADAIRNRVASDIPVRNLWILPKQDIEGTLEASGYSKTEPLTTNDAVQLGKQMRADEFVDGTVTRSPGQVKIDARMVSVRDPQLVQPLGPITAGNTGAAASQLSKEIKAARAQLDDEKECYRLSREGKFAEAIAAARKGIAEYPKATIARTCVLRAMVEMKAPADQLLAMSNEILALDPRNKVALANAADVYKQQGNAEKSVEMLLNLLAAEPTNTRLVEQVVRELGQAGQVAQAKPIIEKAVAENPGDPALVGLAWAVMRAVREWDAAIKYGEELVTLDTARADTTYFVQLAAAYAADSQPQKAAEVLSRGAAKFPTNAGLQVARATALRSAGQNQQAIVALQGALAADPKAPRARTVMAQLYMDINQPDSALATIRAGRAAGDDPAGLAQVALVAGNTLYKSATGNQDPVGKRAGYLQALQFLTLSDSLAASGTTKFLVGVSAFQLGLGFAQEAQAAVKAKKNAAACAATRSANEHFATAQINVPQGGAANQAAMGQIMQAIQQYTPVLESWQKATCK
ncbi:MAG: tetratricopeptide repeat protein [Gemmatimonadaceae bacterium]